MSRFYCPDIATTLMLTEDESNHCVRVLRLNEGDRIEVVDGNGMCYECIITIANSKRCHVEIIGQRQELPFWDHNITVAFAPTKHTDRTEWLIEKCTELGVDRIVPLLCKNSERKNFKAERLRKIVVAAMKQSLKSKLPILEELTPLKSILSETGQGQRFIAYCDPLLPREQRHDLVACYKPGCDVTILIGPEGDFTPQEVEQATAQGYIPVALGPARLRTETAAVAACAMIHTIDAYAQKCDINAR